MFRGRFAIHPRCVEFSRKGEQIEQRPSRLVVTALKSGYVWTDKKSSPQNAPNIRLPKKGTRYDHVANCLEYICVGARIQPRVAGKSLETARQRHERRMGRYRESARALILERGVSVDDPRLPKLERELAGVLVRQDQQKKRTELAERDEWRRVRVAQQDTDKFRWGRLGGPRGRAGY
jgi:hypothetical protein